MLKKVMHLLKAEPVSESVSQTAMPGYAALYEKHARDEQNDQATGDGDFRHIGRLELEILKSFGLQGRHRLLDFGCGMGRLAIHALEFLENGEYWGIDISETMLERAKSICGAPRPNTNWLAGDGGILNTLDVRFDYICAYSVFTHADLEEYYTHLQCMRRVIAPSGRLLTSHLLLSESERAREIFTMSSALPYEVRRSRVLNIVTSRDLVETVAEMASWKVVQWTGGEEARFTLGDGAPPAALGQAIAILEPIALQ